MLFHMENKNCPSGKNREVRREHYAILTKSFLYTSPPVLPTSPDLPAIHDNGAFYIKKQKTCEQTLFLMEIMLFHMKN